MILDVVYNHLGPDGNYLKTSRRTTSPTATNANGAKRSTSTAPAARPVREFFIANAGYWIDEFHFDGFRLDATQQIFDASKPSIHRRDRGECPAGRGAAARFVVIGRERASAGASCLDPIDRAVPVSTRSGTTTSITRASWPSPGRTEAYYSDYRGSPQEIISAARHGFLYQGQRSEWQNKPRGTPSLGSPARRFVCYIENHDQVANSAWGHRIGQLTSPGRYRAATALLLLGPWTPLLFQGQEFAASTPFLYFADHGRRSPASSPTGPQGISQSVPQPRRSEPMQQILADPARRRPSSSRKLDFRQRQNAKFYYPVQGPGPPAEDG